MKGEHDQLNALAGLDWQFTCPCANVKAFPLARPESISTVRLCTDMDMLLCTYLLYSRIPLADRTGNKPSRE